MPVANHFRHQIYTDQPPVATYRTLVAGPPMDPAGDALIESLRAAGSQLRAANVSTIYLVHGTFVGADAWGVLRQVARVLPKAADAAQQINRRLMDHATGDRGNYNARFAEVFEAALHTPHERLIPVRRFEWTSENHHLGRAEAAVRLIDELANRKIVPANGRVLLWGHSHAGNVFALVTNLLAADARTRQRFFKAAESYWRWPHRGRVDRTAWARVQKRLAAGNPLDGIKLDFVTFGAPIRYGWDTGGYAKLMHVVNHRPRADLPEYLTAMPTSAEDLLTARDGDYVHQLGIAGTNIMPDVVNWRALDADIRLGKLLQPGISRRELLDRLKLGMRVADEGHSLLVDYGAEDHNIAAHLAGHGVYTRLDRLAKHAEWVADAFY
jgi:hypothetical protein